VNSAVIVSAVRTAVGKAPKGKLSATRPDDMAAIVMRAAIEQVPGLRPEEVEDIYIGCAMPEAEQGMNVARVAAFRAGLPYTVPAMTLNRFCSRICSRSHLVGSGQLHSGGWDGIDEYDSDGWSQDRTQSSPH